MRRPIVRTLSLSGFLLASIALVGGISWTYAAPVPVPVPVPVPAAAPARLEITEFPVPRGSGPHDVAPAVDGGVWYTAQRSGELGWLNPATGETRHVALGRAGERAAPHGVIVGPDGAPWITDGGLNAIVRVDPVTSAVQRFPLPPERAAANLNTAAFDRNGTLWFTGQSGVYGRLNPVDGSMQVWSAPRGSGPYGITVTPSGEVYYASLAGSHIAKIDLETGAATPIDAPTPRQGARRVWSDAEGRIWVSEWNAGQVGLYDPSTGNWREWKLPGREPMAYAVYVHDDGTVWLTDFGANALVRFDPSSESFEVLPHAASGANVRQLLGRPGEVWGAASGQDRLVVVYTR
jgi:virginiamycin B lyase